MNSLTELLQEQVRDLFDAEKQYQAKLKDMIDRATDAGLRDTLFEIADDTQATLRYLRETCAELGVDPHGVTCEAMRGLIREASDTIREQGDTATIDASLIANAQRIAHYEIAGFGTAHAFARCLELKRAAELLGELNAMAKTHDRALSRIATGGWFRGGVNLEAVQGEPA